MDHLLILHLAYFCIHIVIIAPEFKLFEFILYKYLIVNIFKIKTISFDLFFFSCELFQFNYRIALRSSPST